MIKLAVLGYGVVGSGTVEVFFKNKPDLDKKVNDALELKYILDVRDFPDSPYADKFTKDFNVILNDPEIKVVAEVIGGLVPAYDYVKRLLEAGKSVVTSNKELVAAKGAELLALARKNNVNFFFEASVGGGIPIIRPLHQCLSANEIEEIAGILNGTTNFILTKMFRDGMAFDTALKLAQELGYAERNPAADVEGGDACRKICILASLAFGKHIYPESVHTEGITKITPEDVAYCENWGGAIKLIGYAARKGDKVDIMVCPAFIKEDSQLAGVNDVFNAILVRGDATGDVVFYGKGAGRLPTASAVVSDIVVAAKMRDSSKSLFWEDTKEDIVTPFEQLENVFYLRLSSNDVPEMKKQIQLLFGDVIYLSRQNKSEQELAFITPSKLKESEFAEKTKRLSNYGEVLGSIRVLNY